MKQALLKIFVIIVASTIALATMGWMFYIELGEHLGAYAGFFILSFAGAVMYSVFYDGD